MKKSLVMWCMLAFLSACSVGNAYSNDDLIRDLNIISDRYRPTIPSLSTDVTKAKDPSAMPGWFVTSMRFAANNNLYYVALNTKNFHQLAKSYGLSVIDYLDATYQGTIAISEEQRQTYMHWVFPVANGMYQDENGNLYDAAGTIGKDLETIQAVNEQTALVDSGRAIAADFSLSEEQGVRVAKLANEWQVVSKSRQMTSRDLEAFTSDLAGIRLAELHSAAMQVRQGDSAPADRLIQKAASSFDTTPENMRRIINSFLSN